MITRKRKKLRLSEETQSNSLRRNQTTISQVSERIILNPSDITTIAAWKVVTQEDLSYFEDHV